MLLAPDCSRNAVLPFIPVSFVTDDVDFSEWPNHSHRIGGARFDERFAVDSQQRHRLRRLPRSNSHKFEPEYPAALPHALDVAEWEIKLELLAAHLFNLIVTTVSIVTTNPRHFLYPLNPKAGYTLGLPGRQLSTSRENFLSTLDYERLDEWGVAQNAATLQVDDFIWVHFALPHSAICAVGRVAHTPRWNRNWGRYSVKIRWDADLTKRLIKNPIPLAAHGQVPYSSVTAANARTTKVLDQWLKGKIPASFKKQQEDVRFRTSDVVQRLGQSQFRAELMRAYDNSCAVTGCSVDEVLQAAHIRPVRTQGNHAVTNGLLLRADIHNLFDRGLLTINNRYIVEINSSLRDVPEYGTLHQTKLTVIPKRPNDRPDKALLQEHRDFFLALHTE